MGKYRKVDPYIWNDDKFSSLSDDGQLVFLFLLTHPHQTSLGAMRATLPGLAAERGWTEKRLSKAFGEAFRKGMVKHDPDRAFIWIPNFLRYNPPENPNVVKSWVSALGFLPECSLKNELIQHVEAFAEGFGKPFREALPEAFRKGLPKQEQEQEQEQEKKEEPPQPPLGASPFASGSAQVESGSQREDVPANDGPEGPAHGVREASTGEAAHEGFEAFWREYPRKIGKQAALKAWKRIRPGKQLTARIVEAIQAQVEANHFRGNDGQVDYIPNPATWLNQGRWEDEIVRPKTVEEEARELEERMAKAGGSA